MPEDSYADRADADDLLRRALLDEGSAVTVSLRIDGLPVSADGLPAAAHGPAVHGDLQDDLHGGLEEDPHGGIREGRPDGLAGVR